MAQYLQNWQAAQSARLKHLQFQLTTAQLETVAEALEWALSKAKDSRGESPNDRSTALFLICKQFLDNGEAL